MCDQWATPGGELISQPLPLRVFTGSASLGRHAGTGHPNVLLTRETSSCLGDAGSTVNLRRHFHLTWGPSSDHKSSATHDGERTGRKSLVSLRRAVEPGVHLSETFGDAGSTRPG